MTINANGLPAEIAGIIPEIMKGIPTILKGGWVGGIMAAAVKISPEFKKVMSNPHYKTVALNYIESEFGTDDLNRLKGIFEI